MKLYIDPIPNESGAYPNPKCQPFEDCIPLDEEQSATFLQYNGFVTITSSEEEYEEGFFRTVYEVTPNLEAWEAWKASLPPEPDALEEAKADKISKSKTDLADYLETHPLQWTDGEYYSITAEKQQQLTSKIMAATMAQTLSTEYTLTWNSTGEVCKEWTLQDLSALAFAIDARVTALVTYQQTQEVAMRNAATLEDLEAIVVDYDTVGAAAQEALS